MPANSEHHYPALDGLRGVAALMIVWHHFTQLTPVREFWLSHLARLLGFSWIGVDLFFVLSGFLITGILADSKSDKHYFRAFYGRRILRIFPLYYAVLVIVLLILPLTGTETGITPSSHIFFWTYTSNYYFATHPWYPNYLSHLWTLAIEEQFYLLWPFVIFFAMRFERLRTGLLWAFLSVSVVRLLLYVSGVGFPALYLSTETHCDALILGGYLALSIRSTKPGALRGLRPTKPMAAITIAIVYLLANFDAFGASWEQRSMVGFGRSVILFALLAVLFVWLIHAATNPEKGRIFRVFSRPVLSWFGKYSYALYLLHVPIGIVLLRHTLPWLSSRPLLQEIELFILYLGSCILSAFCSWHLYEKHFLKFKRYFQPDRNGSVLHASFSSSSIERIAAVELVKEGALKVFE